MFGKKKQSNQSSTEIWVAIVSSSDGKRTVAHYKQFTTPGTAYDMAKEVATGDEKPMAGLWNGERYERFLVMVETP